MATGILRSAGQLVLPDLQQCTRAEGAEYLKWVSHFVATKKHASLKLENPPGTTLRIAGLEDTIYSDKNDEVYGWGNFYLPKIVNMQVFGVVEGTPCSDDPLVLMTCEDKKVYAYDGEELHVVASSLDCLREKKIEYPASKTYYNGEAFNDMADEDWSDVKRGAVGRRLEQEHQKLVQANKPSFLECLRSAGHT